ncbi:hypothetical protein BSG8_32340 [Bacillus subtilis subsp. natto]|nr:hypothetical protein BSG8_32340 [Bacillus subtilis subsp. natto]BEH07309.1 hypothetical protein BSNN_33420 [Bacillus subtilis subsp. natto]
MPKNSPYLNEERINKYKKGFRKINEDLLIKKNKYFLSLTRCCTLGISINKFKKV